MKKNDTFELDIDWLNVQNRLLNINSKHIKENMTSISIHYIYIDGKSSIAKIITEKQDLSLLNHSSYVSQENTLKIIQSNKIQNDIKYKFCDILLHNIDIEPNDIQSYAYSKDTSLNFLKSLYVVDEIRIPSTLFIFHQFNCIYILYKEIDDNIQPKKKTKKVHFSYKSQTHKYRTKM